MDDSAVDSVSYIRNNRTNPSTGLHQTRKSRERKEVAFVSSQTKSAMSECPICFNDTNFVFPGCRHPCCSDCAARWLQKKTQCPTCRGVPCCIPITSTAQEYLPTWSQRLASNTKFIQIVPEEKNEHLGITIKTGTNGVVVTNVVSNDCAFKSGLRKNDIVSEINGIRVHSHEIAMDIIHAAQKAHFPILVNVRRKQDFLQRLWSRKMMWGRFRHVPRVEAPQ